MRKIKTRNNISELEQCRFGRPKPRHGLKLLFWFANNCISFDQNNDMIAKCDPKSRKFGFHPFENRYDQNGVKLLPDVEFEYYEVGNLSSARARGYELPDYVRQDFTGHSDDSNMDRIIVSVDNKRFDKVYVTEHDGGTNFNPQATFFISRDLLMIIRSLELNDFLKQTGYWKHSEINMVNAATVNPTNQDYQIDIEDETDFISHGKETCCTIL